VPWLQLTVPCARDRIDALSSALLDRGAVAVALLGDAPDDAVLEPGPGELRFWRTGRLQALLPVDLDLTALRRWLDGALEAGERAGLGITFVAADDWQQRWRQHAVTACFGDRLWLLPRDAGAPPARDAVVLRLDPGLAFGSGSHPSTALCLDRLASRPPAGLRVLDFGTGSGVLAIAAALLGAREVVAVDHDPQSLVAARDNGAYNRVADRIRVLAPEALAGGERFDLVLANILANPLVQLAPRLSAHVALPAGELVLAGITADQAGRVAAAYGDFRFTTTGVSGSGTEDGWVRLDGERRNG